MNIAFRRIIFLPKACVERQPSLKAKDRVAYACAKPLREKLDETGVLAFFYAGVKRKRRQPEERRKRFHNPC
jgi:hypothetical protein